MGERAFTRVNVSTSATVSYGVNFVQGTTENLSLQGFYLRTSRPIPVNQPIKVTLFNHHSRPIQVNAKVVRQDSSGGVGIKISSIDVNSFVTLRNYISQRSDDFNGIMSETYKMVECIH